MSRRGQAPKRSVLPDPVFQSPMVTKFISNMMWGGKKATAEQIFYGAMNLIKERINDDPLKVFKKAIDNVRRPWRSSPAESAAPTTRFRSRSGLRAGLHCRCAG